MYDVETIRAVVMEVLRETGTLQSPEKPIIPETGHNPLSGYGQEPLGDITLSDLREVCFIEEPVNKEFLLESKQATPARIGMYRSGSRCNTKTGLRFRADHAASVDSVFSQVSQEFLQSYRLPAFRTQCATKDEHITRPDLGRCFSEETLQAMKALNGEKPDVLVLLSDGLSSKAVEANGMDALLVITEGLKAKGISVGKPFFIEFGRVGAMDVIAEVLEPKVICLLIGERPGLVTAESMSAYMAYQPYVNMPEARRSVISNIHRQGTLAVEAGAHIVELIQKMLAQKASGLDLKD